MSFFSNNLHNLAASNHASLAESARGSTASDSYSNQSNSLQALLLSFEGKYLQRNCEACRYKILYLCLTIATQNQAQT